MTDPKLQAATETLCRPTEITASLLERIRELNEIVEGLHEQLSGNGERT